MGVRDGGVVEEVMVEGEGEGVDEEEEEEVVVVVEEVEEEEEEEVEGGRVEGGAVSAPLESQ